MKVATVGMLAGLGMILTSVSVWSLTKPKLENAGTSQVESPSLGDSEAHEAKSEFKSGSKLSVEGRLGHARLFGEESNETFLFVDVRAERAADTSTSPLNLAVVIDRSGSMKGKRIEHALDAARGMIRRLRDGDVVSVVTYNTATETLVAPTRISGTAREQVAANLGKIEPRGDTCISCGIDAGMAALRQHDGMVTRMLLLTDGEATAGIKDMDGFRRIATTARSGNVTISSIGVDVDYNERLLSMLALESNGMHHFAENSSSLSAVFDKELANLTGVVAKSAELEIELAPGIEVETVFDRAFRREGRKLFVSMGDFSGEEQKTLLAKVRVPSGAPGARPIADIRLGYEDLVTRERANCSGTLATELVKDKSLASPLDGLVSARVGRTETAAVLREANDLFRQGNATKANERLDQAKAAISSRAQAAASSAPRARVAELEGDLQTQSRSLDKAKDNFNEATKEPPTSAPGKKPAPAQSTRKGKAGLKHNQDLLNPMQL